MASRIIGKDDFMEVYVSTPIEECERRDVKGLYAKARRGRNQRVHRHIGSFRGTRIPCPLARYIQALAGRIRKPGF